jgi:hypothetical protein
VSRYEHPPIAAYYGGTKGSKPMDDTNLTPPIPTQVRKPWRATARTAFAALVALCALLPVLVEQTGMDVEDFPWLGIALAIAAAVTRIMANPKVEEFLRAFLPFLSATGKQ